jgi:sialic acid synthase SpsE
MAARLEIAGRVIADDAPPLIIAEIGNNHDGSLEQAKSLIAAAAEAGADAVKFQTYDPDRLVRPGHQLYTFFKHYLLPREWHAELRDEAHAAGMIFLSTPFDPDAADFLVSLGVPALKIASSDLTNLPLIRRCASHRLPMLISSGMGTFPEIETALGVARDEGCDSLAVLHCISLYPTPPDKTELRTVSALRERFGLPVGFSDHSLSPALPVAAVALGARIIEKHFTIDRTLPGPDHAVALEPDQFQAMAVGCREVVQALGSGDKRLTDELNEVRNGSLRGLYAAVEIAAGTELSIEMVSLLRPATSLTAADLPRLLGRKASKNIKRGEPLSREAFGLKGG